MSSRAILTVLSASFISLAPAAASAQVVVHAIGDLPGGPTISTVRDATRSGGVIYAVGGSGQNIQVLCISPNNPVGCTGSFTDDTPVLWTWNGTSATLRPLPALQGITNTNGVNGVIAQAITPNAAYIASQARSVNAGGAVQAVRVTVNGLLNLNLAASPFPVLPPSTSTAAISADGSVLYGLQSIGGLTRATRFDIGGSTSSVIPLLPGTTASQPALHGTSSDGSVLVGTSFTPPYSGLAGGLAFRYVQSTGISSAIPLLAGGTWNKALAVSGDGNLTLVAGNSTFLPNGEMYLYNAATGTSTSLGSPNTAMAPLAQTGSMTSDGSVIVTTFGQILPNNVIGDRISYFHNSHGWFNLAAAFRAGAADLSAWDGAGASFAGIGISQDGTLVYGNGTHQQGLVFDGFVADFPANFLANFNAPPTPPAIPAAAGAFINTDAQADNGVFAFLPDGTFYYAEIGHVAPDPNPNGFERGTFTLDASGHLNITVLQDLNGSAGLSGIEVATLSVAVAANGNLTVTVPSSLCDPNSDVCTLSLPRIAGGPTSVVGGWRIGNPEINDSSAVLWLLDNGTFFYALDGPPGTDGLESGTYTWDPVTHQLQIVTTVDTNGSAGFSNPVGTRTFVLSADGLSAVISDDSGNVNAFRIGAAAPPNLTLNGVPPPTGISVAVGASIAVGLTNGEGNAGDWMTLAPVGAPPGSYVAWKYLNDTQTQPGSGLPTATVNFVAPATPGDYEVRLFRNNTFVLLSTSARITVAGATLSVNGIAPPTGVSVGSGSTISVGLTNGPGGAGDWIVLALQGAPSQSYVAWKYLNNTTTQPGTGLTAATVTFTAPGAGTYEVRMFRNNTFSQVTTSAPITVGGATLSVNGIAPPAGVSVGSGSTITVGLTNGPGGAGDWIALALKGAPPQSYVAWKYLNDSQVQPGSGLTSATVTFVAPAAGTYEVRLLRNNTFTQVTSSATITVAGAALSVNGVAPPTGVSVGIGSTITVGLTNGPGSAGDWIALALQGAPPQAYLAWKYLNDTHVQPGSGLTSATVTFVAPAAGTYEVRLFRNNTLTQVTSSAAITVAGATLALNGVTGAGIAVASGSTITVDLSNGPGLPGDWLTLAPIGAPSGSYVAWKYLNNSRTQPGSGLSTATVTFTAPAAGNYEVRLFRNNTFTLVTSSAGITVN